MQSIEKEIKRKISRKARGTLIFSKDFLKKGTGEAVRVALHRLNKSGYIKRITTGIYVRPKTSQYIDEIMPTTEAIAKAIAKRDKITIIPTGTQALYLLGLSTQMPMKLVFLTNGAPREIKIGNRTIKLKRTTPKNLLAIGKISSLVIQALREIGKKNITLDFENKITTLLKSENKKHLLHDMELAPVWIKKIMEKAI